MKGLKKVLIMLLCIVMVVGSLSACKKSENNAKDTDGNTTSTDGTTPTEAAKELVKIDYTQPVEYTYWLYATPNDFYSDYSDNPVVWYLNKKFNMTLKFQQPAAGTELDSLNLMLGTGEYTDLIDTTQYSYSGSVDQLYDDGIIIDISKYLDYMPNYKKLLEENDTFRKNTYNDKGQILGLTFMSASDNLMWGGLVYRRDILETMTGGNVQFPSGNVEPTTIEDWDYMLPLMKQYFDGAGMADSAVLILPSNGEFPSNDLVGTFGTSVSYFLDNGTVKYGPMEDGFYNYLKKMNEWYKAGYIYKDFATRTSDPFYLPNTALTYGGAAGIWFGLESQLGTVMSMPDYGLNVDVSALKSPIDAANGKTTAYSNGVFSSSQDEYGSVAVASTCKNVERLLASLDYLYSEEGSMLRAYGLTAEQAAGNEIYEKNGLTDGVYSIAEDGTFKFNDLITNAGTGGTLVKDDFASTRLPGLRATKYDVTYATEEDKAASATWTAYEADKIQLPKTLIRTSEENATFSTNDANITNYVNEKMLKFILGTEELNETTWADFKAQIVAYGVEDNIAIQQAAYERYLAR